MDKILKKTKKPSEINPLPKKNTLIPYQRTFSQTAYELLSFGFMPKSMDDRWLIYMDNKTIFFHRSWTGHCIYKVILEKKGEEFIVKEARANRNPKEFTGKDEQRDIKTINALISWHTPLILNNIRIVGLSYPSTSGKRRGELRHKILHEIKDNERVALMREPNNKFDKNAIRIDWKGCDIGYIAKYQAKEIAPLLDLTVSTNAFFNFSNISIKICFFSRCLDNFKNSASS